MVSNKHEGYMVDVALDPKELLNIKHPVPPWPLKRFEEDYTANPYVIRKPDGSVELSTKAKKLIALRLQNGIDIH